jgi:DNA (cytosine-5)-methyltransferase 1
MSPEQDPADRNGLPKLTVEQVALLQGFPSGWTIAGRKTARYRQVGHAIPPPLATAVGSKIAAALDDRG